MPSRSDLSKQRFVEDERYWAEEEAARAEDEYLAQLAAEQEALDKESAIEAMVAWFEENFEDPQNQTPIDGEEGKYIYIWGGPFDAGDVITSQFGGEFKDDWIDAAIEHVQGGGTFEWAPTTTGDFYDHPEPEVDDASDLSGEDSTTIADRIHRRLDEMQAQLDQLWLAPPPAGHNHPPEDVGLPPYDGEERRELEAAIAITRVEVTSAKPNPTKLKQAESTFRKVSAAILNWLGRKADFAVDESIKAGVSTLKWVTIATQADGIASDILDFLRKIWTS